MFFAETQSPVAFGDPESLRRPSTYQEETPRPSWFVVGFYSVILFVPVYYWGTHPSVATNEPTVPVPSTATVVAAPVPSGITTFDVPVNDPESPFVQQHDPPPYPSSREATPTPAPVVAPTPAPAVMSDPSGVPMMVNKTAYKRQLKNEGFSWSQAAVEMQWRLEGTRIYFLCSLFF